MHGAEKQGIRTVATVIAILVVMLAVSAVALGGINSQASPVQDEYSTVQNPVIENSGESGDTLSEPLVLSDNWDVGAMEVDEIEGVNLTEPDQTFTVDVESELNYSIEFVSGTVVTPEEGMAPHVLEVDYVFDEFSPAFELTEFEEILDDNLLDEELLDEGLLDEEVLLDEGLFDDELLLEEELVLDDGLLADDDFAGISGEDSGDADDGDSFTFAEGSVIVETETDEESGDDGPELILNETIGIDLVSNLSFAEDISLDYFEEELGVEAEDVPVMVQFEGGFDREYIDDLDRLGYQLTDDLTEHTQYALVPAENVESLADLSFVRSVSDIEPETKLSPAVDTNSASSQSVIISTFGELDPDDLELDRFEGGLTERPGPTDDELAILGVDREVYEFQTPETGELYVGDVTSSELIELSESSLVRWIDTWEEESPQRPDEPTTTGGVEHTDLLPTTDGWDGSDTTVGVLDTGIEDDHPHFDETDVMLSYDWTADLLPFTSGDSGEDNDGHGTHVAGIITGEGGGYSGVAPETSLVVSRVLDDPDSVPEAAVNPQTWFTDKSDMWVGPLVKPTRVFDKVAETGTAHGKHVDVMSNSWGYDWGSYDYLMTGPTDGWAHSNPYTLQITSNGNAEDTSSWPAAGKNVLAVGGLDDDHTLSWLNDISPPEEGQVKPDVNAPACITSADIGHTYSEKCGTSMATPYVSGLAARYIGHEKADRNVDRIRANEVKTALIASSTGQMNPFGYEGVGWGAINDLKLYHLATTSENQLTSVVEDNTVNTHSFEVPEDAGHVEVTLSWSEKQNRLTTSFLRNDLHLYLTSEDPDDVIEIDSNWFGSDDVEIDVDEPLQVDNADDRTVRRVGIPADKLESGEWHILVHAEDTTWDSDSVLYDVAIDMQGDEGFTVEESPFEVPEDGQTDVRFELHGGHPGDDSVGMIPELAPGVQLEDLRVVGGDMCGWELLQGSTLLETGNESHVTATVGTVTGANEKYLDVCVETDKTSGTRVAIEYEFSYVEYPDDRVTTRTSSSETGSREGVSGRLIGDVVEGGDEESGGDGPGFTLPVVAVVLGASVLVSRFRDAR